jgi:serine/threonine protein kinase
MVKLVDFGLVKLLAPGEMTITVLQGQGTALYTPLEQYGGDSGHTDVRTDIYAFGATLYHLLTNQPPADARDRFLNPEQLAPPRQINPNISPRTEKAILWAMALHPDDRPQSVEVFQESLLGSYQPTIITRPAVRPKPTLQQYVHANPERTLIWISAGLAVFSLIATLIR